MDRHKSNHRSVREGTCRHIRNKRVNTTSCDPMIGDPLTRSTVPFDSREEIVLSSSYEKEERRQSPFSWNSGHNKVP